MLFPLPAPSASAAKYHPQEVESVTPFVRYGANISGWRPGPCPLLYSMWGYYTSTPESHFRLSQDSPHATHELTIPAIPEADGLGLFTRATDACGSPLQDCGHCQKEPALQRLSAADTLAAVSAAVDSIGSGQGGEGVRSLLTVLVSTAHAEGLPESLLHLLLENVEQLLSTTDPAEFLDQTGSSWAVHLGAQAQLLPSYDWQVVDLIGDIVASAGNLTWKGLQGAVSVYGSLMTRGLPWRSASGEFGESGQAEESGGESRDSGPPAAARRARSGPSIKEIGVSPLEAEVLRAAQRQAAMADVGVVDCLQPDPSNTHEGQVCYTICTLRFEAGSPLPSTASYGEVGGPALQQWIAGNWAALAPLDGPVTVASVQIAARCQPAEAAGGCVTGPVLRVVLLDGTGQALLSLPPNAAPPVYPVGGPEGCQVREASGYDPTDPRAPCTADSLDAWVGATDPACSSPGGGRTATIVIAAAVGAVAGICALAIVFWLRWRHRRGHSDLDAAVQADGFGCEDPEGLDGGYWSGRHENPQSTRAKDVDYVDEPAGDEAATVTCTARKVSGVGIGGTQDGAQGCAGPGIAASQEPAGQPASPTKWGGTPHPQGGEPGRKAYKAYRGA